MPFDEFLGNPLALAEVRAMVAKSRVPGSLLFTGPDGVGKKTLALMLAKALNCERRKDDFCGECGHCRKAEEMIALTREDVARRRLIKESQRRVEGLLYFDLQLIEPLTRNILIEQVRRMREVVYTRPFEFKQRIFVIDQTQAVNWQAVDLLLKMLEEPPETTTFILIAPNAHELRSTIRSRCQRVQFLGADDAVIGSIIADQGSVSRERQGLAVRIAAGSIARAKTLDLEEFERRRRPWLDFLDGIAGPAAPGRERAEPGRGPGPPAGRGAAAQPNWPKVFDSTRALTEDREAFEETLRVGGMLLRDLLQVAVAGNNSPAVVNLDLTARLGAWASRLGLGGIERLKQGLDQAYRLQIRNVNQQLGLDTLAIDASRPPPVSGG